MNTKTQEALKELLDSVNGDCYVGQDKERSLVKIIKEALEQPQPRLFLDLSNSNGNHPVEQPAQEFFERGKEIAKWADKQNEQPAQEPVLLNVKTHDDKTYKVEVSAPSWQGLSDDEKLAIIRKWKDAHTMREQELIGLGDAIEAALKEKNHV